MMIGISVETDLLVVKCLRIFPGGVTQAKSA